MILHSLGFLPFIGSYLAQLQAAQVDLLYTVLLYGNTRTTSRYKKRKVKALKSWVNTPEEPTTKRTPLNTEYLGRVRLFVLAKREESNGY